MCGRYASSRRDLDLIRELDIAVVTDEEPPPSWNVAPTQHARVVLERSKGGGPIRQLRSLQWGLVPSWADSSKIGSRLINARAETVTDKPVFASAVSRRRCLVPADGYYEWERREGRIVPQYLHRFGEPLYFAGIYEFWKNPGLPNDHPDAWLASYAILTTTAADALGHIHNRSPVVLPPSSHDEWLDPAISDSENVSELLASVPDPRLQAHEVSTAVNNHRNNGPELAIAVKLG